MARSVRNSTFFSGLIVAAILLVTLNCERNNQHISPLGEVISPDDNPLTDEKAELGRKLFFDKRLSLDRSISCASCHVPEFAFTDRMPKSRGIMRRRSMRNSPSLLNAGYLKTMMFDAHVPSLEMQAIVPIQDTNEMGILVGDLIERLKKIPEYRKAAKSIYDREFDSWVLTRSLAAFQRTLISDNSRFDQWQAGEIELTDSEKRGWKLFSEDLYCTKCHPAPHFTSFVAENNGLYTDFGDDKGRFRIDFDSTEIGYFKVPSLRNIALTYPYMHDGSIRTLSEVLDHYAKGGEKHRNQSKEIVPFSLSEQDKKDINAFFHALTDTSGVREFLVK